VSHPQASSGGSGSGAGTGSGGDLGGKRKTLFDYFTKPKRIVCEGVGVTDDGDGSGVAPAHRLGSCATATAEVGETLPVTIGKAFTVNLSGYKELG
jgi:hypothetical protein